MTEAFDVAKIPLAPLSSVQGKPSQPQNPWLNTPLPLLPPSVLISQDALTMTQGQQGFAQPIQSLFGHETTAKVEPPQKAQPVSTKLLEKMTPHQQLEALAKKYGVTIPEGQSVDDNQCEIIQAVVKHLAKQYGVPENLALGISGHESGGWMMWSNISKGRLVKGENKDSSGHLLSTDWGVMQINDNAHPKAFPRAKKDLEYNIEFGMKFLAGLHDSYQGNMNLGFNQWDKTIASYNQGSPPSSKARLRKAKHYISAVKQYATGNNRAI